MDEGPLRRVQEHRGRCDGQHRPPPTDRLPGGRLHPAEVPGRLGRLEPDDRDDDEPGVRHGLQAHGLRREGRRHDEGHRGPPEGDQRLRGQGHGRADSRQVPLGRPDPGRRHDAPTRLRSNPVGLPEHGGLPAVRWETDTTPRRFGGQQPDDHRRGHDRRPGLPWWTRTNQEKAAGKTLSSRPGLVSLNNASNVKITGITLKNAPNVNITVKKVTASAIDGITVQAPADAPNTDGIDVWSSSGVAVTNSTIDTGDDDIAINSSAEGGPSHDISLSGCTILHGHGLSIGSYTAGDIYDIDIHDNTLKGTTAGVRIKSARGRAGEIHAVTYKNLKMTDVTTPIQITGYYPSIPADGDAAQPVTSTTPNYHDITLADITATGATTAGQIVGVPEQPITGLTLTSVNITAKTGLTVRNATVSTTSTAVKPASGPAYVVQSRATVK
ncbi:glycoside hydrolase family 28 protein [Streptomyces galilaeus]